MFKLCFEGNTFSSLVDTYLPTCSPVSHELCLPLCAGKNEAADETVKQNSEDEED